MNNQYEYEEEIDMMLLGKALLKKWKIILAVAIVCALLVVGYKFVTAPKPSDGSEADNSAMQEYENNVAEIDAEIESLNNDIEEYEVEKARLVEDLDKLDEDQAKAEEERDNLREYSEKSVILNIDPYNVATVTKTYYVSNDYQIMPGMDYQNVNHIGDIVNSYVDIATAANAETNEVLHTAQGTNQDKTIAMCSVIPSGYTIDIVAIGKDTSEAKGYMNRAVSAIEGGKEKIKSDIGEHEIKLMQENSYTAFNSDLKVAQEAFDDSVEAKLNSIVNNRNSINNRISTINNSIHSSANNIQTQKKNKTALEKPSTAIVSEGGISKKELLKWLMIGFVVGVFIMCIWFTARYMLSGTIKSEEEIEDRYGIKVIGYTKDEAHINVAVVTLKGLIKNEKQLTILSSLGRDYCEKFASRFSENFADIDLRIAGNIEDDVEGVNELTSTDSVVLLEKTDISKIKDMNHELDIIREMGISVVGCIL